MIDVAAAFIKTKGKILVAQRAGKTLENYWEFPGGKIIKNETARQAVVREIHEELNIDIIPGQTMGIFTHRYGKQNVRLYLIKCRTEKISALTITGSHKKYFLGTLRQLSQLNLAPLDRKIVNFLKGKEKIKKPAEIVIIVGHGRLASDFSSFLKGQFFLIAADCAALKLAGMDIIPDLAIGDFDSCRKKELKLLKKKIPRLLIFPPDKDFTDIHLAAKFALTRKPRKVLIFAATGSRLDHTLTAVYLLEKFLKKGIDARIIDDHNEIRLIKGKVTLSKDKRYHYFSLLPFTRSAKVSIKGAKYNLKNKKIRLGESIGVSNEIIKRKVSVSVHKGIVFLIRSKD